MKKTHCKRFEGNYRCNVCCNNITQTKESYSSIKTVPIAEQAFVCNSRSGSLLRCHKIPFSVFGKQRKLYAQATLNYRTALFPYHLPLLPCAALKEYCSQRCCNGTLHKQLPQHHRCPQAAVRNRPSAPPSPGGCGASG